MSSQTTFSNEYLIQACIEDMRAIKHPAGCEGGNYECSGCAIEGRLHELADNLGVKP